MKYKPSLLYHQTLCQGRVSKAKKSAGMIQAGNKQELVAGRTMPGQQELVGAGAGFSLAPIFWTLYLISSAPIGTHIVSFTHNVSFL